MLAITEKELKDHEKLLIHRRRNNYLQEEFAKKLGTTKEAYRKWESGLRKPKCDIPEIIDLTEIEKCFILRLRNGFTHADLAYMMSMSRYWVGEMELGKKNPGKLIQFWENFENGK